ncbi:Ig-like domain-containing protein, partial [Acinetobacter rudis]
AEINADGTEVTGKGEPGTIVEIKNALGQVIGTGKVDENGNFKVTVSPALTDGKKAGVTLKDLAGNLSKPTEVIGLKDTIAPEAPTNLAITKDGETVSGQGEPNAKVVVKDKDGNIVGTGIVKEDGSFTVDLDKPFVDGEKLVVVLEDAAGNVSPEGTVTAP